MRSSQAWKQREMRLSDLLSRAPGPAPAEVEGFLDDRRLGWGKHKRIKVEGWAARCRTDPRSPPPGPSSSPRLAVPRVTPASGWPAYATGGYQRPRLGGGDPGRRPAAPCCPLPGSRPAGGPQGTTGWPATRDRGHPAPPWPGRSSQRPRLGTGQAGSMGRRPGPPLAPERPAGTRLGLALAAPDGAHGRGSRPARGRHTRSPGTGRRGQLLRRAATGREWR